MSALLFNLQNEDVAYENRIILQRVNLKIAEGEKIVLVGPSSAGKTTLLNRLYQMRPLESAFVHQHHPLIAHRSVYDNIAMLRPDGGFPLCSLLNRIKLQKNIEIIRGILTTVGIEETLFEKAGRLSNSQQQRVAVARAVFHGRRILIADEPTAAVDSHQAEAILKLIMETQKTIIIALHSVDLALKYAHRIIGLAQGNIRFDLPVEEVVPDRIIELYL